MSLKRAFLLLKLMAMVFIFNACRPTKVLQHTQTQFYQGNVLNKVVVFARPGKLGQAELIEKWVSNTLKSSQVEFIPGYAVKALNDSILIKDQMILRKALAEAGYGGLLEIKLVSIREEAINSENQYRQGGERRINVMLDELNNTRALQEYDNRVEKGAIYEDIKVKMDVKMYDLTQNETPVIWSARTETTNPKNNQTIAKGCAKKVRKFLKKEEVLGISK